MQVVYQIISTCNNTNFTADFAWQILITWYTWAMNLRSKKLLKIGNGLVKRILTFPAGISGSPKFGEMAGREWSVRVLTAPAPLTPRASWGHLTRTGGGGEHQDVVHRGLIAHWSYYLRYNQHLANQTRQLRDHVHYKKQTKVSTQLWCNLFVSLSDCWRPCRCCPSSCWAVLVWCSPSVAIVVSWAGSPSSTG